MPSIIASSGKRELENKSNSRRKKNEKSIVSCAGLGYVL